MTSRTPIQPGESDLEAARRMGPGHVIVRAVGPGTMRSTADVLKIAELQQRIDELTTMGLWQRIRKVFRP